MYVFIIFSQATRVTDERTFWYSADMRTNWRCLVVHASLNIKLEMVYSSTLYTGRYERMREMSSR